MSRKAILFATTAGLVLVLDQATKAWVQASFRLYESVTVVKGLFHLTYVRNPGAAFGLFSRYGEDFRRPFFLAVTILALAAILLVVRRLPPGRPWTVGALALIFGGALGNMVDRLRWGAVVDFLDVFWRTHHWPAFNVADSAITVGVTILVLIELFGKREKPRSP